MSSSLLSNRKNASIRAQRWLVGVSTPINKMIALQQLGLLLCQHISEGSCLQIDAGSEPVQLPSPAVFVTMSRDKILALTRSISLSNPSSWNARGMYRHHWTQLFGGVALSYAQEGDLPIVAALVRAASYLGLTGSWLIDAETYMLDQQQPDGHFGLLGAELALLKNDVSASEAMLSLTVEVLWALAETGALAKSLDLMHK